MENKLGNSDGDEVINRKRTLDLKSIYWSESIEGVNGSGEVEERINRVDDDSIGREGRKRKRKKIGTKQAAGVNSVENSGGKSDRSLNECYGDGIGTGLASDVMVTTQLGVSQKSNSIRSNGSAKKPDCISLSSENNISKIPKRKRDVVRRKQVEFDKTRKVLGGKLDTDSSQAIGQTPGLASDPFTGVDKKTVSDSEDEPLKTTLEKKLEHLKDNSSRRSKKASLLHYAKMKNSDSIGGSSELASKNKQKKRKRKSKDDVCLSLDTEKGTSSPARNPIDNSARLLDDEEENLEQNAARMLSSRFNSDLTGFSCDRKDSLNDLSAEDSTGAGFRMHNQGGIDDSDSALDDNGIVLRPRKELKAKSLSRKRRHFYEVVSEDLDPCWVLKKRIKVFWPLDKSWYIGHIKDYDPKKKRHHVKYEDREEEWIDLRSERFKLLLFPSEIPCKAGKTRSLVRDFLSEPKKVDVDTKSSGMENFKDSEPIISWLSRTNKKLKTASSGHIKNPESRKETQSGLEGAMRPSKGDSNPSAEAAFPVDLRNILGVQRIANDESVGLRVVNFSAVYSRRRFQTRRKSVNSEDGHMLKFASDRVAYFDRLIENSLKWGEIDAFMGHQDIENPSSVADIGELLGQLAVTNLCDFKLNVSLPGFPILERVPLVDNCWLLHSIYVLQYGAISCLWPKVQLEILFVDNSAGVKLFLFEKSLIQAVKIIFRIFSTFCHYPDPGKYNDLQTPVTSLRVQFSSPYDLKQKISYSFSFFSQLRDTKWSYLDFELKRRCLFTRQLDLPECAYDNIDKLLSCNQTACTVSSKKWPSAENEGKCKENSLFGVSSSTLLDLHLEQLIGPRITYINSIASDSFPLSECTETSGKCVVNCNPEACNGIIEIDSHKGSNTLADHKVSVRNCSDQMVAIKTVDVNKKKMSKEHFRKDSSNSSRFGPQSSLLSQKANDRSCHQIDFDQSGSKLLSLLSPMLPDKSSSRRQLRVNRHGASISLSGHTNENGDEKVPVVDLARQLKQGVISRNNPTAPRSIGRRTKNISPSFGPFSCAWHDGQSELDWNGSKSGTKKLWTATQASNSLPDADTGWNSNKRIPPLQEHSHKKMKKPQENKTVDSPRSPRKNLDLSSCAGNILIILEDRCWRESEAQVFLQPADHNEWVLSVKVGGAEKYTYKANQLLQSGATNRFTYAMMWKGGKDWTFEFPDRSQWVLFKEMHNECYNRNLRAGSVKIIPIPGVRLVDDFDDNVSEATPFSFHPNYYLQSETDVEIALNPLRVVYDMDSEDEQWLSNNQMSSEDNGGEELMLSEEFFEKTMDMFEKAAYVRKHDQFAHQEIEELFAGIGPTTLIMKIHDYWSQKRQRTGMPLLRQLQPPLWEMYQKQLQEWERAVGRFSNPLLSGGNKPPLPEKPPMFAFCLKPRGLEVTSRGTKQRTHKKYHGPGHSGAAMGDHDGYHAYGRRYNRYIYMDERVTSPGSYDSEFSPRLISPRDGSMAYFSMSNGFERDHQQKPYRIKSKKIGSLMVPIQPLAYNPQTSAMSIEPLQRKTGCQYWPHQKMMYPQLQSHPRFITEQLDGPDLEEFKLRDASGAAQHARVMAKLKRQKAERLHYRADLAMQKAMIALNIAKAIKESQGASSL